jgi:excisionase family DNA binding protein
MPRTPTPLPDLVSLAGAARILGASKQYVHRLVARGEIVGARLDGDGAWVFRRDYIEGYARAVGKLPESSE